MKKRLLVVSALVLLIAGGAQAAFITAISGADIDTSYSDGVLTLSDTIELVVSKGAQQSVSEVSFLFTATLLADDSMGGKAHGVFGNGTFVINDGVDTLLSGQVQELTLEGIGGGFLLAGSGLVTLDAGTLLGDIAPGYALGEVVAITFSLPAPVVSFAGDYAGSTNLSILPIPEPTTMALLGLGAAAMLRRKRN